MTNILTFREAEKYKKLKSFVKQWVSDRFEAEKVFDKGCGNMLHCAV